MFKMKKTFMKPAMNTVAVSLGTELMAASGAAPAPHGISASRSSYSTTPGQAGPVDWN